MRAALWISTIGFGVGCIFDLLTTVLGIADILGGGLVAWILAIAGTSVVIVLNFQTRDAFVKKQWWIVPFCVLAILFDFYTSMAGEQYLPPNLAGVAVSNPVGWITLAFIAFFFVASPVFLFDTLQKFKTE